MADDHLDGNLRARLGRQPRGLGLQGADGEDLDPEKEFDALLAAQDEFQRKRERPSARAVYGASEDGDAAPVGRRRPASLFKQQRQGTGLRPPGARGKAFHPEMAALPILEGPDKDTLTCLSDVVKERRVPDVAATAEPLPAPLAGFPVANHRAIGKSLGCANVGSNKRAADAADNELDEPENEEEAIDRENRQTLNNTAAEEIAEWQKQLLQQFGPEMCEFLKRRGQQKEAARKQTKSEALANPLDTLDDSLDDPLDAEAPAPENGPREAKGPKEEAISVDSVGIELHMDKGEGINQVKAAYDPVEAMQALAGGCINRAEQQKLQWTTPAGIPDFDAVVTDASLPPEPAGKVVQLLRFDFEGRICIRTTGEDDRDLDAAEGLHHHGAESMQAGYTLSELLLLSRSSSAPQRSLALSTLACVLLRARLPSSSLELLEDPALQKVGLSCTQTRRAGFGLGLSVLFWHGVARGDFPKHLVEGLQDPMVPVQLAALRAVVALLDGGLSVATNTAITTIRRTSVSTNGDSIWEAVAAARSSAAMALCSPLDAARELVWPDAPPTHAAPLARRARVTVRTPEGGGDSGGGAAAWPNLLRSRLLHAKKKDEVTAVDVLEPLLSNEEGADSDQEDTANGAPSMLGLIPALQRCMRAAGTDHAVLSNAVRALAAACVWSPALSCNILENGTAQRKEWLCMAGGGGVEEEMHLRFEFLHLIRVSCEVGSRSAAAWWLADDGEPPPRRGAGTRGAWTAVAAVRRAVLDVFNCQDASAGAASLQVFACALEGVRIWLAWFDSGVGVDRLDSFMPAFSKFLHQLAEAGGAEVAGRPELESQLLEWRWLLAASLLRLLGRILSASEDGQQSCHPQLCTPCAAASSLRRGGLIAEAVGPLATALGRGASTADSAAAQLCTADFVYMMMLTLQSPACAELQPALQEAARSLLTAWPHSMKGSLLPDPGGMEHVTDDEEAPWPLGGAASGVRLQRLAHLRAVRSMCLLAAVMPNESSLPWLCSIAEQASSIVAKFAPPLPLSPTSEVTVGAVQRDPWAAVLVASWIALAQCGRGSPLDDALLAGRALMLCGCWATARDLLACTGLRLQGLAEEAVLRAAYRPWAPWVGVIDSVETRHAVSIGIPLPLQPKPAPNLGPPELSFAAAAFWALAVSPPREAAIALLKALTPPAAEAANIGTRALMAAVPPWLPFIAFASFLSAPMLSVQVTCDDTISESGGEWAWADDELRPHICAFADAYFAAEPAWLAERAEWLTEALRGLCDRLSTVFTQDSFGDPILARTLWAFAAPAMPKECRDVCWGAQDPAVLALLSRGLGGNSAKKGSLSTEDAQSELLWPLAVYLAPLEDAGLMDQALSTLGIDAQRVQPPTCSAGQEMLRPKGSSWPELLAAHHAALLRELD